MTPEHPRISQHERKDFERIRPLIHDNPLLAGIGAVIDGSSPGRVYVDEVVEPTAALVWTPEGHYMAGDEGNRAFLHSVREFIAETVGSGERWWYFYLRCPSEEWAQAIRQTLPTDRTVEKPREFYICDELQYEWRGKVPSGYEMTPITEQVLSRGDLRNADRIRRAG